MEKIIKLYQMCIKAEANFMIVFMRSFWYFLRGKKIFSDKNAIIKGVKNIQTDGRLFLGLKENGLTISSDKTLLRVKGKMIFKKDYHIARGSRIVVGDNAEVILGEGRLNANSMFVISNYLSIGDHTGVSWDCQILDDDLHDISYPGKKNKDSGIIIGNHVLIGSKVTILKGSRIPDNCVVAAGTVVASVFDEENCLIAGNPATVIKRGVTWS